LPQFTAPVLGEQYVGLYRQVIAAFAKNSSVVPAMVAPACGRRSL
jgi:hypothetical protein